MNRSTSFLFSLTILGIILSSCDNLNTKVPASEIKKASSWSGADQYPTFSDCQGMEGKEAQQCFGDILGESLTSYIYSQELVANRSIDAEIILVIEVNKEGTISLSSIEDPNYVLSDVLGLGDLLEQAVEQSPKALPAVKTNADTAVTVSIKLPVQIIASAAE